MEIGVVWAFGLEHLAFDATNGEIAYGIFYGGVGLQWHTDAIAVEVDGSNVGLLIVAVGLFLDDGGDGKHLVACKA